MLGYVHITNRKSLLGWLQLWWGQVVRECGVPVLAWGDQVEPAASVWLASAVEGSVMWMKRASGYVFSPVSWHYGKVLDLENLDLSLNPTSSYSLGDLRHLTYSLGDCFIICRLVMADMACEQILTNRKSGWRFLQNIFLPFCPDLNSFVQICDNCTWSSHLATMRWWVHK